MGSAFLPGLVSVIVPTFNREILTIRALESVVRQTYRPVEVIIIDDGSSDETANISEQWAEQCRCDGFSVRVMRKENGGAPSARNVGLQSCCGEYIQFLDSDDALAPGKIEHQVEALVGNSEALYVWSGSITVKQIASTLLLGNDVAEWRFSVATQGSIPANIGLGIFRRAACQKIGTWNEGLKRYQDWDYSVRYMALGEKSLFSRETGYIILSHHEPRISDINRNGVIALRALLHAAKETEAALGQKLPRVAATKIAQKYSSALLHSIRLADTHMQRAAIAQIRRLLPGLSVVRVKNEFSFVLAKYLGPTVALWLIARVGRRK